MPALMKNTYGNKKKTYTIYPDGTSSPKTKENEALMNRVRKKVAEDRRAKAAKGRAREKVKQANARKKKKGISKPKDSLVGDTRGIIRYI